MTLFIRRDSFLYINTKKYGKYSIPTVFTALNNHAGDGTWTHTVLLPYGPEPYASAIPPFLRTDIFYLFRFLLSTKKEQVHLLSFLYIILFLNYAIKHISGWKWCIAAISRIKVRFVTFIISSIGNRYCPHRSQIRQRIIASE